MEFLMPHPSALPPNCESRISRPLLQTNWFRPLTLQRSSFTCVDNCEVGSCGYNYHTIRALFFALPATVCGAISG